MVKTWILATTGALAVGAIALVRRWRRRRAANVVTTDGQAVSAEWLSHARSHDNEVWP